MTALSPSPSRRRIHSLPARSVEGPSLKEEIEAGLLGDEPVVPGPRDEDKQWGFKRTVPTMVLYDEQGLKLYDKITSDAHEYYLFPDELNLLKDHGDEIARAMGFPGKGSPDQDGEDGYDQPHGRAPLRRWRPARWGDTEVGKWNGGVNGEEGLGGGFEPGWDVVELGAGALRKTAHLLTALSSAVPAPAPGSPRPPITYHPLDLSYPELDRVLGEMDEAFGQELKGKVDCIGLHGDYDAGLKFIRQGKLDSLRPSPPPCAARGRTAALHLAGESSATARERDPSSSPESLAPITPHALDKPLDDVQLQVYSPDQGGRPITPGMDTSPLPSSMTDDTDTSKDSGSGTWSPVDSSLDALHLQHRPSIEDLAVRQGSTARPLHFVFLGSSLGNFPREAAPGFLASLPLRAGDTLLLGLDGRPPLGEEGKRKVEVAYNDPAGHTRAFEEHGWDVVRAELGLVGDAGVDFVGRYNELLGRHEAYFKSRARQTLLLPGSQQQVTLEKDELLNIEWSYKYSLHEALDLFQKADLRVVDSWKAPDSEYRLWLLERPSVRFAPSDMSAKQDAFVRHLQVGAPKQVHLKGVPSIKEWEALWKLWDHITLEMIPEKMLHTKPIDLRHICLFYLGHIPTFLDIHLTRMTNGYHTEPEYFKDIFERGIDPDVDDPTQCHSHSEVPTNESDWPALPEILAFRDRVRQRLRGIYEAVSSGASPFTRHVGRVLFMTYEHEAMHAETLLYMLIQSAHTRPPTAVASPQWDILAKRWDSEAVANTVLHIPAGDVAIGHDDAEGDDAQHQAPETWADHEFGWDIEHPRRSVHVEGFKVDSLPVTNNDYLAFLKSQLSDAEWTEDRVPASWVKDSSTTGEAVWKVRTLYGPVGFDVAGLWPLLASKVELDQYAKGKGGRLPTEAELRLLWEHPDGPRPAGLQANVGFKNWHPVPPANTSSDQSGAILHGHNGGVWEWTSTEFAAPEGFIPSELYPGYSADFFDGKHYKVLGGSYATIPAIAERKSFVNWYQAVYRYAWCGGRVAYDP